VEDPSALRVRPPIGGRRPATEEVNHMLKSRKAEVIDEIEAEMRSSTALIVADYRGLSVGAISGVRDGLRPLDATLRVSKNTLARIAAERTGNEALAALFVGPTAIAFCKGEPAAVAKKLSDAARETRILRLKGGMLDGRVLDEDGVKRLATLPSKEVLQAQVVGVVAAPLQTFVTLLGAAPREFVVVLDQIIQKKQAEAA
jgi:large subunit ribosomal protein L10